jgi:hypothetical protein
LGEINEKLSNPFLRGGVEEGANAGVCFTGVYFILQNIPLRPSREGNRTIPRFYLWYTITYFISPKPFTLLTVIPKHINLFDYEIDMERFNRFWAGKHPC